VIQVEMAKYSVVGGGDGGCCGAMSGKAPLIGFICTLIGLALSVYVYIDTSSVRSDAISKAREAAEALNMELGDEFDTGSPWVRNEVISLLIGSVMGIILLIVYIPVVIIEMGCCCCLGTVKETVLKGAFEQKGKVIKVILTVLSLLAFALVLVYLVHGEIIVGEFKNKTTGVLTIVGVVSWLLNLVISIIYLRD